MSEGGCGRGCVGWMSVAALCAQRRSTHPTTLAHALRASLRAAAYLPRKKGALKCKGCATQAPTCEHFKTPPPCVFLPTFFSLAHVDPCWRGTSQTGMPQHKPASQSQPLGAELCSGSERRGRRRAERGGTSYTHTRAHPRHTAHARTALTLWPPELTSGTLRAAAAVGGLPAARGWE